MKILIAFPGPRHSTIDVANGWSAALAELGHDVTEFRFSYLIDFFITAYQAWERAHPNNPGAKFTNEQWQAAASKQLIVQAVHDRPDIVLMISGMQYHPIAFRLLHNLKIPIVLILTESPYMDNRQLLMMDRGGANLTFTNDKASVKPLSGFCPVVYLPHSYNPATHYSGPAHGDYETDIYFCGTLFPDRLEQFSELLSDRSHMQTEYDAYIIGPTNHRGGVELIDNAENAEWYRGTKIALNHHRVWMGDLRADEGTLPGGAAYSLNPRAYEIAACGAFQLCDDQRPELKKVFGDSIATYNGKADMMDKIKYYLAHDAERKQMAKRANELVRNCAFINRAQEILIPAIEKYLGG
ncbi:MAG: hypothetical protein DRJ03_19250 [Chloroflexi bacterium]|nr:MAG: hypothetical protein DRJ03_19250 [Chloroflexota bacterium]